jgi:GNAT superfamily N-acetyltransferase
MNLPVNPTTIRATDDPQLLDQLAEILIDCVEGGASVTFMSPLPLPKARAFWHQVIESAHRHERILLIAEDAEGQIHGTVQVVFAPQENQPHRAEIAKLLVHRRARGTGVGQALMRAAEDAARQSGRTLLVLDTVTGGTADRLYARLGWHRLGVIPNYALGPTGDYCDATYFYKSL